MTYEVHCYEIVVAERVNNFLEDEFGFDTVIPAYSSDDGAVTATIHRYNII